MSKVRFLSMLGAFALLAALGSWSAKSQENQSSWSASSQEIKHVFVIALENHDWTQPATVTGGIQPIYQNANAPFINSLVNGTALAFVDGHVENIGEQVA